MVSYQSDVDAIKKAVLLEKIRGRPTRGFVYVSQSKTSSAKVG